MKRTLYIKVELNNKTITVLAKSIYKIKTKFKQAVEDMQIFKNKLRKTHR